ncbi:hypothetical protein ACFXCZ_27310 [Streptomyces sp. NPDC059396]|uniref:hypothetical protein n=1 Tax=Streptomyces sp. NPDC059396 TaxID=3346819 RepID=UPI0036B4B323
MSTPTSTVPWFTTLTGSVYALYQAAGEYRTAHRAALLAVDTVSFDRRVTHDERIVLRGTKALYGGPCLRRPHGKALSDLSRVYSDHKRAMYRRYERAALLYASGCVWAITSIQRGDTPGLVEFNTNSDRQPVPYSGLDIPGLVDYDQGPQLDAAYDDLMRRLHAADYAEEIAGRPDHEVTESDATVMFEGINLAEGIADAAWTYGRLAHPALLQMLRPAKHEHAAAREREHPADEQQA